MKFPRNDEERVTMIQVADWIEKGLALPNLTEDPSCYLSQDGEDGQYNSDVLGLALAGKMGSAVLAHQCLGQRVEEEGNLVDEINIMQELLEISPELTFALDHLHCEENVSAQELANRLRAGELECDVFYFVDVL